jgi:hypothetical protein
MMNGIRLSRICINALLANVDATNQLRITRMLLLTDYTDKHRFFQTIEGLPVIHKLISVISETSCKQKSHRIFSNGFVFISSIKIRSFVFAAADAPALNG